MKSVRKAESGPGTSIWGAFALMLMLVLSGGMVLYGNGSQLLESNRLVMHTYQVVGRIEAIRSSITTAESATRGYALLDTNGFVVQFNESKKDVAKDLSDLQHLTLDDPVQRQNIDELQPVIAQKMVALQTGISERQAKGHIPPDPNSPGPKLMSRINHILDRMEGEESSLLAGREVANRQNWERAAAAFWAGIGVQVLALVALLLLATRIIRIQYEARIAEAAHRAELERQVELRTSELKATNEELEGYAAAVSHDLQAPLRHIDAVAAMLREDIQSTLTNKQSAEFGRIRKEIRRMNQIIEDLLRLSRTARGEVQLAKVDLSGLVEGTWREVEERSGHSDVVLNVQPGLDTEADPSMVQILLENLLSNARKYSSKTTSPHVDFGATDVDGITTYFVKDNGVGFNPMYVNKLFQPFTRLHSEQDFEGSGLGLAICKRIVTRHGGRIWAESELGHGATFFFTLQPPIPSGPGHDMRGAEHARRR